MNRGQAKGIVEHAELVRAFSEGKDIQYKTPNGEWRATDNPLFTEGIQYRIKPQPRHLWRVENPELGWKCWGNFTKEDDAHLALATTTSLGDEGYVVNEYVQVMK